MAAIDYASIPESTRQSLLAATYKMAIQMFQDPEVVKEYEIWRRQREEQKKDKEQIKPPFVGGSRW